VHLPEVEADDVEVVLLVVHDEHRVLGKVESERHGSPGFGGRMIAGATLPLRMAEGWRSGPVMTVDERSL
jgi:hypothetical protein